VRYSASGELLHIREKKEPKGWKESGDQDTAKGAHRAGDFDCKESQPTIATAVQSIKEREDGENKKKRVAETLLLDCDF